MPGCELMLWAYLFIGLLLGILLGAIGMHLWSRGKGDAAMRPLLEEHASDKRDFERRISEKDAELSVRHERVSALSGSLGAEQEKVKGLEARLAEQVSAQEQAHTRMQDQFKLIANELLASKGKELGVQQTEKLNALLEPLKERIKDFEKQVKEAYEKEGNERFALKKEIGKLVEQNQKLSADADNLTRALKGDSKTQGDWGEMVLEKLLEDSGLMKGQEYSMQESTTQADGSRLRPDAVIFLPEGKHLIIDAKVSLLHYEGFASATDPTDRDHYLKLHVESLRSHAKDLGAKNYTKLYGVNSVDFVLMFVPIEPAFLLALRERPAIFQEAYDRQVVMVTHSTLMATLRTIHGIWKNERIAQNHMEIADRAGSLYDKFVGFTEDLLKVGKQLEGAQDSYKEAMKKLSEGPGNLVRKVEMVKELGAKTSKALNPRLVQRSLEEPNSVEP